MPVSVGGLRRDSSNSKYVFTALKPITRLYRRLWGLSSVFKSFQHLLKEFRSLLENGHILDSQYRLIMEVTTLDEIIKELTKLESFQRQTGVNELSLIRFRYLWPAKRFPDFSTFEAKNTTPNFRNSVQQISEGALERLGKFTKVPDLVAQSHSVSCL